MNARFRGVLRPLAGSFLALICASPFAPARAQDPPPPAEDPVRKKAIEDKIKAFNKAYAEGVKEKDAGQSKRVAALRDLMTEQDPKIQKILGTCIDKDASEVRLVAIEGIGMYEHDAAAAKLLIAGLGNGANKKEPIIRAAILRALGAVGDPASVKTVNDAVADKDLAVAAAAAEAAGRIRAKSSVDVLLTEFRKLDAFQPPPAPKQAPTPPAPRAGQPAPAPGPSPADEMMERKAALIQPIKSALMEIARQQYDTFKEWDAWWKKAKSSFDPNADAKPK